MARRRVRAPVAELEPVDGAGFALRALRDFGAARPDHPGLALSRAEHVRQRAFSASPAEQLAALRRLAETLGLLDTVDRCITKDRYMRRMAEPVVIVDSKEGSDG